MGLDMYAYTTKQPIASDIDFDTPDDADKIFYWRKHPNLHGHMKRLYRAKGGKLSFNCVNLRLNEQDLFDLECVVRRKELPQTVGFFFGMTDGSEYEADLQFIAKARDALKDGFTVYYSSWW